MSQAETHPVPTGPPTELGRLRILSSTAGMRVSRLALGGGNIGQKWQKTWGWGDMDKERAFKLLDTYYEAGGNFIDTANMYQNEESETWIGEWMAARQNRDHLVLATKYTLDHREHALSPAEKGRTANFSGNHRRSLHMSVRDSLKKLQTDYIDIMYIHFWDYQSSIEEVMDSLHNLVQQGKVMYLGASDTPAWVVSMANIHAREKGKTQFSVYSGRWNLICRDFEREIIPMCRQFGMALSPWGTVGGGKFQRVEEVEERNRSGEGLRGSIWRPSAQSEYEIAASEALTRVAAEIDEAEGVGEGEGEKCLKKTGVTQVALAYVLNKATQLGVYNVFPVVGGRKVEQLEENIRALKTKLTDAQMEYLESVKVFELGFPHDWIGTDPNVTGEVGNKFENAFLAFPGARPGKKVN